ncbi:DNA adenine methylase [Cellulomonas fimi]|uniref:DNA adenine methylase n=1 Tax=Cellulomonas sp. RIT-PI-Y TaxID=3035297 RepID=UPI0021DAB3A1
MPRYISPLRYPGGKARLAPFVATLLDRQRPRPTAYAEPFAGGAGAALHLLVAEEVDEIYINDLNPGVAAFWRAAVTQPSDLCAKVLDAPVDLEAWHEARRVYALGTGTDLDLGFATFFLNRCNRSGILNARPIGGLEQTGNWKIDARYNRDALAERIERIGRYSSRIHVSEQDARDFLVELEASDAGARTLVYVDPPYLGQGENLYLDSLSSEDHKQLAGHLTTSSLRWFLTYDADPRIPEQLYPGLPCVEFDIAHTAQVQHVGTEYAVFSPRLQNVPGRLLRNGETRAVAL